MNHKGRRPDQSQENKRKTHKEHESLFLFENNTIVNRNPKASYTLLPDHHFAVEAPKTLNVSKRLD